MVLQCLCLPFVKSEGFPSLFFIPTADRNDNLMHIKLAFVIQWGTPVFHVEY